MKRKKPATLPSILTPLFREINLKENKICSPTECRKIVMKTRKSSGKKVLVQSKSKMPKV